MSECIYYSLSMTKILDWLCLFQVVNYCFIFKYVLIERNANEMLNWTNKTYNYSENINFISNRIRLVFLVYIR